MNDEQISSHLIQWEIEGHRLFYNRRIMMMKREEDCSCGTICNGLEIGEWSLRISSEVNLVFNESEKSQMTLNV